VSGAPKPAGGFATTIPAVNSPVRRKNFSLILNN
jgi:hypothetical protein